MISKTRRSLSTLMAIGMLGVVTLLPGTAASTSETSPAALLIPLAEGGRPGPSQTPASANKISVAPKFIPEPSTSLLSALGILIIFRRRRH